MINDYGFRINKYVKVSIIIGLLDIINFYIAGKCFFNMDAFNLIINNWKYISMFIAILTIVIYFIDITFLYNRKLKYTLLFIFKEPFQNWQIYACRDVEKKHNKLDFYFDIYSEVKDKPKIVGIMLDEIVIRDISIHLLISNPILLILFFIIQNYNINFILFCILLNILFYFLSIFLYRNFLKYYITEIYIEFLNKIQKK